MNSNHHRPRRRLLAVLAAAALVSAIGFPAAAAGPAPAGHGPGAHAGHGPGGHGGMHGRAAEHLHHMLSELDLTPAQRETIHGTLQRYQEDNGELRDSVQAARQALNEKIHADAFDESAIRDASGRVAAAETELALSRARLLQEIRAQLTQEQLERLEAKRERMRSRRDARQ